MSAILKLQNWACSTDERGTLVRIVGVWEWDEECSWDNREYHTYTMARVVCIWFSSAELCVLGFASGAEDNADHWRALPHPRTCSLRCGLGGAAENGRTWDFTLDTYKPSFCFEKSISLMQLCIQCPIPWKQRDKDQIADSLCTVSKPLLQQIQGPRSPLSIFIQAPIHTRFFWWLTAFCLLSAFYQPSCLLKCLIFKKDEHLHLFQQKFI